MGYVLRVRLASFFAGAATASFAGLYFLYKDFKVAHDAISQQVIIKTSKKKKSCSFLTLISQSIFTPFSIREKRQ
ncbi:ABC TRANSPORTER A FAMILY PROTEIN [Salix koriyanagi]|uniref:ABC TRANSPORTER A FAMILY PROTEIN n=1 Tax=Salix koriyanagi TaxID=2511006 RepID=A0A9Q0WCG0_9ROSI|nr:ABC TRANSPORTER A FAMILY PROTEIN [Salix koriyanagi]